MEESAPIQRIDIPILAGSFFDLAKFDFSFKDISIIDIESEEFKNYLEKFSHPSDDGNNFSSVKHILSDKLGEWDKKYAVIKTNPLEEFNQVEIGNVWKILLIIFPGHLREEHELHFFIEEGFLSTTGYSSEHKVYPDQFPGAPLNCTDRKVAEINEFIHLVLDRLNRTDYIGLAIYNYIISYSASHYHYQFTSLFTSLDCLVNNESELQYRLKRMIAILCGEDMDSCKHIFKNVNTLALIRNDIVHGNNYDAIDCMESILPLQSLVSFTITELLIHNISKDDLNETITRLGFGDRNKISNSWKAFHLNIYRENDINLISVSRTKVKEKKK